MEDERKGGHTGQCVWMVLAKHPLARLHHLRK
jgi:hypothetical protein